MGLEGAAENGERTLVVLVAVLAEEAPHRLAGAHAPRLAGLAADDEHDRAVLGRARRALRAGADEDRRAARRVGLLAVDGERGGAFDDDVQLLVAARAGADLFVLADHERTALRLVEGVHAERVDVEVAADVDASATAVVRIGRAASPNRAPPPLRPPRRV